ncbi:MAG: outer membrane beta-barrel protein [Algoriphagus sp.]|uniref:outer membrane beta-barrel protein n=1 Tax=Algoriphagus sp. TaxID=1872435 RepID=UPI00261A9B5B|nr:outer membrane beta-barrel protein [Algoriphagus sp.]MDG1276439.1 outer membrane beta-barrel protein [Algoriphagus sp.]
MLNKPNPSDKLLLLDMRLIGIFILLLTSMSASFAQTSIGIRGGYTTSSYSYRSTPGSRASSVPGIGRQTFALVFEHFNSKNAGIEANLQYLSIGFAEENGVDDPILINETEFNYLKMPLVSSFFIGKSGRFQIKIGPHFGYLLNAQDLRREFENSNSTILPTYGGEDDQPKKLMYGITAGAGISKLFGKSTLAGEVRFAYDFTNPENLDRVFEMSSTNLEFTLAYLFQVKKLKQKAVDSGQ